MNPISHPSPPSLAESRAHLDRELRRLFDRRMPWVQTSIAERIVILEEIKDALMPVAQAWAETAARKKGIASGSPLEGEEWLSGPYAVMAYCNLMMETLKKVEGKYHLDHVPVRQLANGQVAVRVLPHSLWDRLLLSGITIDVWMQPGVDRANIRQHTAATYDPSSPVHKTGGLGLVLGAGNINAIAPLDVFHKLFVENEVVMLKLNPVNDYLHEFLIAALGPLIVRGALRIVRGGTDVGEYLCSHPLVESIHITGAGASHDAIVWGVGEEGQANRVARRPRNSRRITSELGAVCPTIVVPGPWSQADIRFQAEQVATQKLHNSGFNCVACQVLVLPGEWEHKERFVSALEKVIARAEARPLYYPGTEARLTRFRSQHQHVKAVRRKDGAEVLIAPLDRHGAEPATSSEVFGPALNIAEIGGINPEAFLIEAIRFANEDLYGTLGANIVIHPATLARMGRQRFEEVISELRYGTIAINAWTGLGFLSPQATWGAFPGHSLEDVRSGVGVVHNTFLFDRPERSVVEAPFRPFPRNLLSLSFSLLPRPPWFITNRRGGILGRLLVSFQYRPGWLKLPRIFLNALRG